METSVIVPTRTANIDSFHFIFNHLRIILALSRRRQTDREFSLFVFLEVMPELHLLGADIALVFFAHRNGECDTFANGDTVLRQ